MLGERGVNDVRTQVFRVVGKYAAPDDWTITPAYLWQRTAASDTNIFYPDIGLYDQDKRVAEPYADYLNLPSLTVTKSFGWADLTSVTTYFKRDFRRTTDGTQYNSNIFANPYVVGGLSTRHQSSHSSGHRAADLRDPDRARILALAGGLRRADRAILAGAALEFEGHVHRRHPDDLDGRRVFCESAPAVLGR